jgi:hypothetical protein
LALVTGGLLEETIAMQDVVCMKVARRTRDFTAGLETRRS